MNDATLTVEVVRKWDEAHGICGFELRRPDRAPLPGFDAGAHVDVHLPGGLIRRYSLCGNPARNDCYEIAVLRDANGRGGSMAMHDQVRQGDLIRIGAPRNHFPVDAQAARHLLLAGGIGVTPILAMAEHLAAQNAPFDMHYCARSRERAAFVERLAASAFQERVQIHFDDAAAHQAFDIAAVIAAATAHTHLYVCGPRGFMESVLAEARSQGWADHRLHHEFFASVAANADAREESSFTVRIASSGVSVEVPAGCTVVESLAQHGVDVLTSCGQGVCGTCVTRVLAGEPDHRDSYLTDEEKAAGEYFLPCCSRSRSPVLVLDL
ncbi:MULTISPECIES: PDR/VanB family oxidoreductase [Paraburkholderia]|uniref:Vanillate O-demethylase ferredoxin subunit n=1 Tax=Paraburkholderia phenazinium TaxID=60549 RepID=A0A1N6JNR5_9BURK|nr:PDR/VanB family oxidoreductase [Paraburkholderia phenazinium]SIO45666.1 vanillate O-demethylase ferredoxin subunit [Paraburkholderia phenazinium]